MSNLSTQTITKRLSGLFRGSVGKSTSALLQPFYPWYGGLCVCVAVAVVAGWWSYATFQEYRGVVTVQSETTEAEGRLYRVAEVERALVVIAERAETLNALVPDTTPVPMEEDPEPIIPDTDVDTDVSTSSTSTVPVSGADSDVESSEPVDITEAVNPEPLPATEPTPAPDPRPAPAPADLEPAPLPPPVEPAPQIAS